MDIYFCDLCGVRVTETDLRTGHGIRSRLDVICGTCLEMGHGKEWLSQRARPKAAATAAAASPTIDAARDRAQTFEDQDGVEVPPAVEPMLIQAEVTPTDAHPTIGEDDLVSTAKVPGGGQDEHVNLASAASLFSALGASEATGAANPAEDSADEQDDLPDQQEADAPVAADASDADVEAPVEAAAAEGSSPFAFDQPQAAAAATAKPASDRVARPGSDRVKKPSTSQTRSKSSIKSKSAIKGGKGRGKPQGSGARIAVFSVISLSLIGCLGVIGLVALKGKAKPRAADVVFQVADPVRAKVKVAKEAAVSALRSKKQSDLESAKLLIQDAQQEVYTFESTVQNMKKAEWDQDAIDRFVGNDLRWPDTKMLLKNINDELFKLNQNR